MSKLDATIPDYVALCEAVESRFLDLTHSYQRIKGVQLEVPECLTYDFIRFREMRVRHKSGDYRNTEAELKSLKEIATWTLMVNAAIRNQPPPRMQWREDVGL